uniref:Uncharacterized protein n=1 Tax=Rhizophora mucronata TaxID=61149 RepID=A0A2P2IQG4_RHIMU
MLLEPWAMPSSRMRFLGSASSDMVAKHVL